MMARVMMKDAKEARVLTTMVMSSPVLDAAARVGTAFSKKAADRVLQIWRAYQKSAVKAKELK